MAQDGRPDHQYIDTGLFGLLISASVFAIVALVLADSGSGDGLAHLLF